jgi:hypothetical protein
LFSKEKLIDFCLGDLVIPEPEVEWFSLEECSHMKRDELILGLETEHYPFLVLGTDGLWDALSNPQVAHYLTKQLNNRMQISADYVQGVCEGLLSHCRSQTRATKISMDNTTVILLCFKKCEDPDSYMSPTSSCLHCFQSRTAMGVQHIINSQAESLANARKQRAKRNQRKNKTKPAKHQNPNQKGKPKRKNK